MYNDKLMETEMRSIEYIRQTKFIYKALWSSADVEHFVFFSKDSRGYFEGTFGLRNRFVEEFGIDAIIKYGHPNRQLIRQYRDPRTACSMSFEFGRIDKYARTAWPRTRVQDVPGSELAIFVASFVTRYVLPIVRHVEGLNPLLDLLISNEEPTPWFVSGPAIRAAQVVALAKKLELDRGQIRRFLAPFERMIAIDLIGTKVDPHRSIDGYFDTYIDQLLLDLSNEPQSLSGC
jgi:hypothetical protein